MPFIILICCYYESHLTIKLLLFHYSIVRWESFILSLLYVAYVIVMVFNNTISDVIQRWLHRTFDSINFDHLNCTSSKKQEDAFELTPTPSPPNDDDEYEEMNSNHIEKDEIRPKGTKGRESNERDAIYSDVSTQYGTSDEQGEYIEEAMKEKKNSGNDQPELYVCLVRKMR